MLSWRIENQNVKPVKNIYEYRNWKCLRNGVFALQILYELKQKENKDESFNMNITLDGSKYHIFWSIPSSQNNITLAACKSPSFISAHLLMPLPLSYVLQRLLPFIIPDSKPHYLIAAAHITAKIWNLIHAPSQWSLICWSFFWVWKVVRIIVIQSARFAYRAITRFDAQFRFNEVMYFASLVIVLTGKFKHLLPLKFFVLQLYHAYLFHFAF